LIDTVAAQLVTGCAAPAQGNENFDSHRIISIGVEGNSRKVKASSSFLKKKNQKTFDPLGARRIQRAPQRAKVFASFSKKKCFLACNGSTSTPLGISRQARSS
jgi:hypothetical protein